MLAPIILFTYNRPEHTLKTIEALKRNELASESLLYIFCDGIKENAPPEQKEKIQNVRNVVHSATGFKKIIIEQSETNKGLAKSVIYGVTKIINKYGCAIVIEDDIITHPFFLRFMNDCLVKYENRKDIYMIGGFNMQFNFPWWYMKDIYIVHRSCSWGWATWKDRWNNADWAVSDYSIMNEDTNLQNKFNRGGNDMFPMLTAQMQGKIDSWAIRWDYCLYKHDAVCIRPAKSFVSNCGFDGTGVHCGTQNSDSHAPLYNKAKYKIHLPLNLKVSSSIERRFKETFTPPMPPPSFSYRLRRTLADIGVYSYCRKLKHLISF